MKAQPGKTYALVSANQVQEIFTSEVYSEWDENSIEVIELTKAQEKFVYIGCPVSEGKIIEPSLAQLKGMCLGEINARFSEECETIKGSFVPSDEQYTWETQAQEALAFQKSKNAKDAPMLSTLASARGIDLSALVNKVVEKNTAYRSAIAALVGNRQALEDKIEAAKNINDLNKIVYISPFAKAKK